MAFESIRGAGGGPCSLLPRCLTALDRLTRRFFFVPDYATVATPSSVVGAVDARGHMQCHVMRAHWPARAANTPSFCFIMFLFTNKSGTKCQSCL